MDVDDTLVLILERIDSPISLIRAASTCRRWRRVIADAGFLRRYRSLHGPPVAGDYHNGFPAYYNRRCIPSFVPSSSIDARHFSLDFVVGVTKSESRSWFWWDVKPSCISMFRGWGDDDDSHSWYVRDSRGSLLLMECIHETRANLWRLFPDLVVCEPLTQRYMIIPQLPDFDGAHCKVRGPFLVDGDEDEAGGRISMSNFRVLCVLVSRNDDGVVARTTVFTAGGHTDSTWIEMAIDDHMGSGKKRAYPCEFSWPPVLQACLDR